MLRSVVLAVVVLAGLAASQSIIDTAYCTAAGVGGCQTCIDANNAQGQLFECASVTDMATTLCLYTLYEQERQPTAGVYGAVHQYLV